MGESEMKIEKNIPFPTKMKKYDIVAEMEIGDSILCKNYAECNGVKTQMNKLNFKFRSCTVKPEAGYEVFTRIWRIA